MLEVERELCVSWCCSALYWLLSGSVSLLFFSVSSLYFSEIKYISEGCLKSWDHVNVCCDLICWPYKATKKKSLTALDKLSMCVLQLLFSEWLFPDCLYFDWCCRMTKQCNGQLCYRNQLCLTASSRSSDLTTQTPAVAKFSVCMIYQLTSASSGLCIVKVHQLFLKTPTLLC